MVLLLIGALTAKPHAFRARSWELENIETIDIFDSLCSNIRIDVKNSDIVRILPVNNQYINEEWISDKTRFAYDSLKRWRFIYPMYKNNQNMYVQTSWNNIMKILTTKIKSYKSDNIIIKTGSFTDVETIVALQTFSDQNKNIIINNEITASSDISNYFFNLKNIEIAKIYIFVGNNLRYENPILNVKFKKMSKIKSSLIGYIGVKHESTLDMYHLGTNLNTLKNILEGKHNFIKMTKLFIKNIINAKNNFNDKIWLIFGKDFNNKVNTNNLSKLFNFSFNKKFSFFFMQENVGKLNAIHLGFFNKKVKNSNDKYIYYLIGCENIKQTTDKDFLIFQGHHNDKMRMKFDVIMPTVTWVEKNSLYLNCFGFLQKSNFVMSAPTDVRLDWKIVRMLSIIFNKDITYFEISDIHFRLNQLLPNFKNHISEYKKISKYNINYINNHSKFVDLLNNNPLTNQNPYYYLINSVERASKTLNLVLKNLRENESNFL